MHGSANWHAHTNATSSSGGAAASGSGAKSAAPASSAVPGDNANGLPLHHPLPEPGVAPISAPTAEQVAPSSRMPPKPPFPPPPPPRNAEPAKDLAEGSRPLPSSMPSHPPAACWQAAAAGGGSGLCSADARGWLRASKTASASSWTARCLHVEQVRAERKMSKEMLGRKLGTKQSRSSIASGHSSRSLFASGIYVPLASTSSQGHVLPPAQQLGTGAQGSRLFTYSIAPKAFRSTLCHTQG
jgi:hypothetical protein